jgi:hypothetical protein
MAAEAFEQKAERALADAQLRKNFAFAMGNFILKRKAVFSDPAETERLRLSGEAIKRRALARLPELLEQLEAACTRNGIRVHWAETTAVANRIVLGIIEHSKHLLRQLQNVELVELASERECCGFGGTFSIKQPAISGAMVNDKVDDIQRTGASRVIAGDCGCLLNISGAAEQRGLPFAAQHLADFIWERTHGG